MSVNEMCNIQGGSESPRWKYIAFTEGNFKTRTQGHVQSFTNAKKNATELAKFVWEKNTQPEPTIKYDIIKSTVPYEPGRNV